MRRIGQYPLLIFIGLILIGFISRVGPLGSGLFNMEFDYCTIFSPFNRPLPEDFLYKVAVIYLDEQSHQVLNQPDSESWDRHLHAQLLNKLTEAGTELVYFDILFQETGRDRDANRELTEAIKKNGSVVLISKFSRSDTGSGSTEKVILPIEAFKNAAAACGLAAFREATDGSIRRLPVELDNFASAPWAAKELIEGKSFEGFRPKGGYFSYYSSKPTRLENTWSYYQILNDSFDLSQLKGKWVFIGAKQTTGFTGSGKDTFKTSYSRITGKRWNGVDFHIAAFENYLSGQTVSPASLGTELLWIVLVSLILVGVILIPSNRPRFIYLIILGIVLPLFGIFWAGHHSTTTPYLSFALVQLPAIGLIVLVDRPFTFDLFISYSHSDNERLDYLSDLTQAMYQEGLRCWSDSYIEIGDEWRKSILKAVERSRSLLVVVSRDSQASVEILTEVRLAQHHQLEIFPVFLDIPTDEKLSKELGGLHRHDLASADLTEVELRKLASQVRKKIKIPVYRCWINKLFFRNPKEAQIEPPKKDVP